MRDLTLSFPLVAVLCGVLFPSLVPATASSPVGDSLTPLQQVMAGATLASDELMQVYDLDVFRYFTLYDYDTDLKKAMFRKTPEYQSLLDSLKRAKDILLTGRWYLDVTEEWYRSDYDLDKGGFYFQVGDNGWTTAFDCRMPKTVGIFYFPSLVTTRKHTDLYGNDCYTYRLFTPMSPENGLVVESGSGVHVYLLFQVAAKREHSYTSVNALHLVTVNSSETCLDADAVRVVVANDQTGDVYFNKVY
jgi:hypothetical protein